MNGNVHIFTIRTKMECAHIFMGWSKCIYKKTHVPLIYSNSLYSTFLKTMPNQIGLQCN